MLSIDDKHIARLKFVLTGHKPPELPHPDTWKSQSDDDILIRVVSQVAVIGNAKPAEQLKQHQYRDPIQWDLVVSKSDEDAAVAIWTVLREIGSRYAGKSLNKCRPTKSLVFNRNALRDFPGGPKGFLKTIATMEGNSIDKINFVTNRLQRIKHKGARDWAMRQIAILEIFPYASFVPGNARRRMLESVVPRASFAHCRTSISRTAERDSITTL